MPNILTIVNEAKHIVDLINRSENPDETLNNIVNDLSTQLEKKIDKYHYVIEQLNKEAEFLKEQKERFQHAQQVTQNAVERLKNTLKEAMKQLGSNEIVGEYTRFKLFSHSGAVEIISESAIPADYKQIIQTIEIDKEALKKDLKAGIEVPGASLKKIYSLRSKVGGLSIRDK